MIYKNLLKLAFIITITTSKLFSASPQVAQKPNPEDEICKFCNDYRDVIQDNAGNAILFDHKDQCFYILNPITNNLAIWSGIYNMFAKRNFVFPAFKTITLSSSEKSIEQEIKEQLGLTTSDENEDTFYFIKDNFKLSGSFNKEKTIFTISGIEEIPTNKESLWDVVRRRASSLGSNGSKN